MFIPSQGFRHAVTLLLTNRVRAIPHDASPESVAAALNRLAEDLVALARDMRGAPGAGAWLIDEYGRTIGQLSVSFDVAAAKQNAAMAIASLGNRRSAVERRDLFLIYVPEDRLPIAAPLAIELTKRRISVAFAEYEVATPEELAAAVSHGIDHHIAGVLLWTRAFSRAQLRPQPPESDRFRVLNNPEAPAALEELVAWTSQLRARIGD